MNITSKLKIPKAIRWIFLIFIVIVVEQLISFGISKTLPSASDLARLYIFNIAFYFVCIYLLSDFGKWEKFRMVIFPTLMTILALVFIVTSFSLDGLAEYFRFGKISVVINLPSCLYQSIRGIWILSYAVITVLNRREVNLLKQTNRLERELAKSKQLQSDAEIASLRSQLGMHFFHNAIDVIGREIRPHSDKGYHAYLLLTELTRYATRESANHKTVPIQKEIRQIQNYLKLLELTCPHPFFINYQIDPAIADSNIKIPPMLYISFLENIHIHGYIVDPARPAQCRLYLEGGLLIYESSNAIKAGVSKPEGGLGMENSRKRLDYLFGGKYELKMPDQDNMYSLTLTINL